MKPFSTTSILTIGNVVLFFGIGTAFAQAPVIDCAVLRTNAMVLLAPLPDRMPGAENDSTALVTLGRKLYFEKRLSRNQSQACATCHPVLDGHAGMDNQPTSLGVVGKRGARNSPTTLNAGLHFRQFWDGRAADLKEQSRGPILNPVEMAMPDEASVLERLKRDNK